MGNNLSNLPWLDKISTFHSVAVAILLNRSIAEIIAEHKQNKM